jgi:pimeloyl-ACP methyl ester carboxylesterase
LGCVCAVAGCGGHGHGTATATATTAAAANAAHPKLTGAHPCPGRRGFTCATLTVPLDHAGEASGSLRLDVGIQNGAAPRGTVVFLTGGPGQPGVPFIPRIESRLGAWMQGYRLVMFDQRGTGAGALSCPKLQRVAGASDLAIVPPGTVADCARLIGPRRRFYTTSETVADIEQLRQALGVPRLTLDGVSYGTFVAERYALAYPGRVARLVLDSVVPQQGADPLSLATLQATGRVLRSACRQQRCGFDPAGDVATIVRVQRDGPQLLNALVAQSIAYPSFAGVLPALHAAAAGHTAGLARFFAGVAAGEAAPAALLSQGLHESTLCPELGPAWDPRSSPVARAEALVRSARLPASAFYPFDRATAVGNGIVRGCLQWPSTAPPALPAGDLSGPLPRVPVLLFAGERDLSTPLAWAREEAARAPQGQLVAVPGAGHSVQLRAADPAVRRLLQRFLAR